ncbi:hypothetical protein C8R45DRAFT_992765 [Mycena sanguinolenta]|nr:hypothetical protein C8R45DRAFT_992765 [Mycena sanguinolenta]
MEEVFWEEKNGAIKYSPGQWNREYSGIYHASAVMRTTQIGDSMSVAFQGSAIKFMGAQGWNHGTFLVNLDGEETKVDGYCCGTGGGVPQVIQFEATALNSATHTLNITNLARGRYGAVFEVDALLITPHPTNHYSSFLSLITFVIILAFALTAVRRRLVRLANTTSHQMLPIASSNPQRVPVTVPSSQPQNVRHDKGARRPDAEVPYSSVGASGSGNGGLNLPPHYTAATTDMPQLNDELVERIAQRLARLVREDSPPTYETSTTTHPPAE